MGPERVAQPAAVVDELVSKLVTGDWLVLIGQYGARFGVQSVIGDTCRVLVVCYERFLSACGLRLDARKCVYTYSGSLVQSACCFPLHTESAERLIEDSDL